ncbi:P-loop containing nucleoside triphosphate hydrolase protein [Melampsora americana]|nr:P-loop containing nucleoside triphosphate hydrolase protein [Melampsora americana]
MTDLIFNFDTHSNHQTIKPSSFKSTPGNWTQKLKQKRKAKLITKKLNQATSIPSNQITINHQDHPESNTIDDPLPKKPRNESTTRSQKDITNPQNKIQYISSLFSSTIIPTISESESQEPVTLYAPSNASLSEIQITSSSLNLHPQISQHLSTHSKIGPITSPTGIQSISWPLLTSSINPLTRDVIIQSQTGSGKTLAYLVPIIQDLLCLSTSNSNKRLTREIGTMAMILVPTRELAEQVTNVAINLLSFASAGGSKNGLDDQEVEPRDDDTDQTPKLNPRWLVPGTVHGGTNRTHEKARLRRGVPLLVCTPGRLLDHLEKTAALRLAGDPPRPKENQEKNPNKRPLGEPDGDESLDPNLNLRWLVVDEADRLMDMGFEEQMKGILKHLTDRETKAISYWERKRQTINRPARRTVLCSATMPDGVKKLVGMTLNDPISLKSGESNQDPNQAKDDNPNTSNAFSAPSQLTQHYVVTPPKLRLVSLIALLRQITSLKQAHVAEKVLVFMSCTASVDFHFEAFGGLTMSRGPDTEEDGDLEGKDDTAETQALLKTCLLLPGTKIFRLHGNLDLQTRLSSLQAFSKPNSSDDKAPSILFCTSLAGRGLDVPFVSHVIQYDLPTEGGVTEYLHRVGRTARAGQLGEAWSFLLPREEEWVEWCEKGQRRGSQESVKIQPIGVENLLKKGFGGNEKEWETRATDVQMAIERWVVKNLDNTSLASKAFSSHIRAYATHPTQEKHFFHVKSLHLGHLAKSFGLREAPKRISGSFSTEDMTKPISKRQMKLANRRNRTAIREEEEEEEDEDRNESRFVSLSQFKHKKNGNSLKGPLVNGVDEFNIGGIDEMLRR